MSAPRFTTKQQRLIALVDRWRELHGHRAFRTREVAEWAEANNLSDVPARGCTDDEALQFERRLASATREGQKVPISKTMRKAPPQRGAKP